ncbi:MAG: hypothetical protein ACRDPE_19715 [Solirubrobacterales bacterium]
MSEAATPREATGKRGWIGVDLDGTLAEYDHWEGATVLGAPIPAMVERVKGWLEEGWEVRIFTARAFPEVGRENHDEVIAAIEDWCQEHVGHVMPVTCVKDFGMAELWDDRAVAVEANTGRPLTRSRRGLDGGPKTLKTVGEQIIDMTGCARCDSEGHDQVRFEKLENPMMGPDGTVWEWWAACPTNGQPIMMREPADGDRVFACRR